MPGVAGTESTNKLDNFALKWWLRRAGPARRVELLQKLKDDLKELGLSKEQVHSGLLQLTTKPCVILDQKWKNARLKKNNEESKGVSRSNGQADAASGTSANPESSADVDATKSETPDAHRTRVNVPDRSLKVSEKIQQATISSNKSPVRESREPEKAHKFDAELSKLDVAIKSHCKTKTSRRSVSKESSTASVAENVSESRRKDRESLEQRSENIATSTGIPQISEKPAVEPEQKHARRKSTQSSDGKSTSRSAKSNESTNEDSIEKDQTADEATELKSALTLEKSSSSSNERATQSVPELMSEYVGTPYVQSMVHINLKQIKINLNKYSQRKKGASTETSRAPKVEDKHSLSNGEIKDTKQGRKRSYSKEEQPAVKRPKKIHARISPLKRKREERLMVKFRRCFGEKPTNSEGEEEENLNNFRLMKRIKKSSLDSCDSGVCSEEGLEQANFKDIPPSAQDSVRPVERAADTIVQNIREPKNEEVKHEEDANKPELKASDTEASVNGVDKQSKITESLEKSTSNDSQELVQCTMLESDASDSQDSCDMTIILSPRQSKTSESSEKFNPNESQELVKCTELETDASDSRESCDMTVILSPRQSEIDESSEKFKPNESEELLKRTELETDVSDSRDSCDMTVILSPRQSEIDESSEKVTPNESQELVKCTVLESDASDSQDSCAMTIILSPQQSKTNESSEKFTPNESQELVKCTVLETDASDSQDSCTMTVTLGPQQNQTLLNVNSCDETQQVSPLHTVPRSMPLLNDIPLENDSNIIAEIRTMCETYRVSSSQDPPDVLQSQEKLVGNSIASNKNSISRGEDFQEVLHTNAKSTMNIGKDSGTDINKNYITEGSIEFSTSQQTTQESQSTSSRPAIDEGSNVVKENHCSAESEGENHDSKMANVVDNSQTVRRKETGSASEDEITLNNREIELNNNNNSTQKSMHESDVNVAEPAKVQSSVEENTETVSDCPKDCTPKLRVRSGAELGARWCPTPMTASVNNPTATTLSNTLFTTDVPSTTNTNSSASVKTDPIVSTDTNTDANMTTTAIDLTFVSTTTIASPTAASPTLTTTATPMFTPQNFAPTTYANTKCTTNVVYASSLNLTENATPMTNDTSSSIDAPSKSIPGPVPYTLPQSHTTGVKDDINQSQRKKAQVLLQNTVSSILDIVKYLRYLGKKDISDRCIPDHLIRKKQEKHNIIDYSSHTSKLKAEVGILGKLLNVSLEQTLKFLQDLVMYKTANTVWLPADELYHYITFQRPVEFQVDDLNGMQAGQKSFRIPSVNKSKKQFRAPKHSQTKEQLRGQSSHVAPQQVVENSPPQPAHLPPQYSFNGTSPVFNAANQYAHTACQMPQNTYTKGSVADSRTNEAPPPYPGNHLNVNERLQPQSNAHVPRNNKKTANAAQQPGTQNNVFICPDSKCPICQQINQQSPQTQQSQQFQQPQQSKQFQQTQQPQQFQQPQQSKQFQQTQQPQQFQQPQQSQQPQMAYNNNQEHLRYVPNAGPQYFSQFSQSVPCQAQSHQTMQKPPPMYKPTSSQNDQQAAPPTSTYKFIPTMNSKSINQTVNAQNNMYANVQMQHPTSPSSNVPPPYVARDKSNVPVQHNTQQQQNMYANVQKQHSTPPSSNVPPQYVTRDKSNVPVQHNTQQQQNMYANVQKQHSTPPSSNVPPQYVARDKSNVPVQHNTQQQQNMYANVQKQHSTSPSSNVPPQFVAQDKSNVPVQHNTQQQQNIIQDLLSMRPEIIIHNVHYQSQKMQPDLAHPVTNTNTFDVQGNLTSSPSQRQETLAAQPLRSTVPKQKKRVAVVTQKAQNVDNSPLRSAVSKERSSKEGQNGHAQKENSSSLLHSILRRVEAMKARAQNNNNNNNTAPPISQTTTALPGSTVGPMPNKTLQSENALFKNMTEIQKIILYKQVYHYLSMKIPPPNMSSDNYEAYKRQCNLFVNFLTVIYANCASSVQAKLSNEMLGPSIIEKILTAQSTRCTSKNIPSTVQQEKPKESSVEKCAQKVVQEIADNDCPTMSNKGEELVMSSKVTNNSELLQRSPIVESECSPPQNQRLEGVIDLTQPKTCQVQHTNKDVHTKTGEREKVTQAASSFISDNLGADKTPRDSSDISSAPNQRTIMDNIQFSESSQRTTEEHALEDRTSNVNVCNVPSKTQNAYSEARDAPTQENRQPTMTKNNVIIPEDQSRSVISKLQTSRTTAQEEENNKTKDKPESIQKSMEEPLLEKLNEKSCTEKPQQMDVPVTQIEENTAPQFMSEDSTLFDEKREQSSIINDCTSKSKVDGGNCTTDSILDVTAECVKDAVENSQIKRNNCEQQHLPNVDNTQNIMTEKATDDNKSIKEGALSSDVLEITIMDTTDDADSEDSFKLNVQESTKNDGQNKTDSLQEFLQPDSIDLTQDNTLLMDISNESAEDSTEAKDSTDFPSDNFVVPSILNVQSIPLSIFEKFNDDDIASEINRPSEVTTEDWSQNMEEHEEFKICLYCTQPGTVVCEKCLEAPYCSKQCQEMDWNEKHHIECNPGLNRLRYDIAMTNFQH